MSWRCQIVPKSCPYGDSISAAWEKDDFYLRVDIESLAKDSQSDDINQWFHSIGGGPLATLYDRFHSGINEHSIGKLYDHGSGAFFNSSWYIPFYASNASVTQVALRTRVRSNSPIPNIHVSYFNRSSLHLCAGELYRDLSKSSLMIGESGRAIADSMCHVRISYHVKAPEQACQAPQLNFDATAVNISQLSNIGLCQTPSLADAFIVSNPASFQFIHSADEFKSWSSLQFVSNHRIVVDRDTSCPHSPGLRQMVPVREGTIVGSQGGLYLLQRDGTTKRLTSLCFDTLFVSHSIALNGSVYKEMVCLNDVM